MDTNSHVYLIYIYMWKLCAGSTKTKKKTIMVYIYIYIYILPIPWQYFTCKICPNLVSFPLHINMKALCLPRIDIIHETSLFDIGFSKIMEISIYLQMSIQISLANVCIHRPTTCSIKNILQYIYGETNQFTMMIIGNLLT